MPLTDPVKLQIVQQRVFMKKVCRKCGALNPIRATKCRRCHSTNLRLKKKELPTKKG
ncbi:MAG: 50S ribosomal protein L40e [Saccharolobus sp.]|jgi:large subunit ribosomal protein L40e|uniref:Large ribosomal subunit protein eL40 n=1 Tax=Saccharolobus caldissimus TaxID=1702097 RepID=A0AAQ4CMN6_9CREN|nr:MULTISPECIES: 50S ribosomal protein L40e [Saccharolobus]MDT7861481.1 50S ribosomal protein L40e [Saccharolobus sp.]BDB97067.1 50S ribosomal protein L40e [Saccharolobus caldissimus]